MKILAAILAGLMAWPALGGQMERVQTVFLILMENTSWVYIKGNSSAPYINNNLLPMAAYAEEYYTPPGIHPSEPNYLWLEAGTNFGIVNDNDPADNHQPTTAHLVTLLQNAGISWKTYQEDISGAYVPLASTNAYAPKHNPFVYFDDVTGTNNPAYSYGIEHIRPYNELAADLANGKVARYNFIVPNLCNDMHDACAPINNQTRQGDTWLADAVPPILNSAAYRNGGALFITWDEGSNDSDGPMGMIVLSPLGRGGGYHNSIPYTHSSTLRTFQEIFGVPPLLGDAAQATDLRDLFCCYGWGRVARLPGGAMELTAVGVIPGRTNLVHASSDLRNWTAISTNMVHANTFTVTDTTATNGTQRFYRLAQTP